MVAERDADGLSTGFCDRLPDIRRSAGAYARAERRKSENKRVTLPPIPADVIFAKSVDVRGLTILEWLNTPSDLYAMALEVGYEWDEGIKDARAALDKADAMKPKKGKP